MTNFDDIRPYQDDEVQPAIQRLLQNQEFIRSITAFRFSRLPTWARSLMRPLVRYALNKQLRDIDSVNQLQSICSLYLDKVIKQTISDLSISGLENLTPGKPYLFISNHRDIVMDPAFVNYALYHNDFDTARIAIGDNLLQKPFVSDLMRLNKSFIVKRSASGIREKMAAYTGLSSYIEHSIREGCTIWIAQREGRAKDGIDHTDPAIIKMLYMSQRKSDTSFSDYINWLNIVPVVISYEYNPCDRLIARELYEKQQTGSYQKQPGEDLKSIVTGITGYKGHVHVSFGEVLKGDFPDAETVAATIDQQMVDHYVFHPSNYIAAQELQSNYSLSNEISETKRQEFKERLKQCDEPLRKEFLALYANALLDTSQAR